MKTYRQFQAGFTIIELMAATAVFALMMVFTAQMIGHTAKITTQTSKQVESTNGALTGLDAIARDLRHMVRTQGFTMIYAGNVSGDNDTLTFLSMGRPRGSTADTPRYIALQYQIDNNSTLVRLEKPVLWSDNVASSLTGSFASAASDVVSERILRMEIAFVWKDGNVTADVTDNPDSRYTVTGAVDISKLSAVVIGVVTMDQKSLDLLGVGNISSVSALFDSVNANGQLPLDLWQTVDVSGLAAPVRSGIRFFQRVIPIN